MSETPSNPDPATQPVVTPPAAGPARSTTVVDNRRGGRLTTVAAWVGIVAGVVFIVAVVFFSGFVLGKASDGGHRGPGHGDRDRIEIHRGGPPPWGPGGPERPGPGFGPGGPGGPGAAERPAPPQPPTPPTSAPARPS